MFFSAGISEAHKTLAGKGKKKNSTAANTIPREPHHSFRVFLGVVAAQRGLEAFSA